MNDNPYQSTLYLEILNHLKCGHCSQYFTIADRSYSLGDVLYCPQCGRANILSSMQNGKSESVTGIEWKLRSDPVNSRLTDPVNSRLTDPVNSRLTDPAPSNDLSNKSKLSKIKKALSSSQQENLFEEFLTELQELSQSWREKDKYGDRWDEGYDAARNTCADCLDELLDEK